MLKNLQLVFDCTEPDDIMRFWGGVLGYSNEFTAMTPDELTEWRKGSPQFDGRGRIDDEDGRRMPIYIQKVPEPKSGRNRLRPEIAVPDVASFVDKVLALGGRQTDDGYADVEGNEFSVVEDGGDRRLCSIVIDALDPRRLLVFWSDATGYVASADRCDPPPGAKYVLPFSDGQPRELDLIPGLRFVATDEPKRVKNRLHLDLHVSDAEAWRDRLVEAGATILQWDIEHVLADPEGNEFCVN
jgi:predicted enzyme related to lactoylglutathione lyase